jgi:excisionase family DNA binding protein
MSAKQEPSPTLMLTVADVAGLIQCSTRHVYRMEERGEIPRAVRLGANVRWPRAAIDAWLARGCPKNSA